MSSHNGVSIIYIANAVIFGIENTMTVTLEFLPFLISREHVSINWTLRFDMSKL